MKKRASRSLAILSMAALFGLAGCEFLEDCGSCVLYTEDSDGNVSEAPAIIVCGESLAEKQASTPTTVLGKTTWWLCE